MLNPDYRDILSIFNDEKVEYLLVGAYALAAHGNPRATGDIDLWIRPSRANANRVVQALSRFGAPVDQLQKADFEKRDLVFQIGVAPRRIDIMTSISGVERFEDAWRERLLVEVEGLTIPVISRKHLIENKRVTGRPQDLADVAWLETG